MKENERDDSPVPNSPDISHLKRREIQAPVAVCLIRGFAGVLGGDRALETATAAIQAEAETAGSKAAESRGSNTLHEFRQFICENWAQEDAIEIRDLKETDRQLSFRVVRCRYAELYDRMGAKDLGFCLSCSRDASFARGFNPRLEMVRTRTIMQGDSCCDFLFTLADR
jgi:hypothetical protein